MSYNQQARLLKINRLPEDRAAKLVYEWVKTGVITLKEFRSLLCVIRDPETNY